jgi:ABC-type branched-subunit amino acid transport system substrate-binding protein
MKRLASVIVGVLAIALIAGCGSSSSSGGGSSKGPIKILTYGDITGLTPTPSHQLTDGVEAAVDAFNAAGGVQGRKVQLITCDTQLNPAHAANCVAKAKAEGVVAAIPSEELLDNVTTPLLEKQGIPILGSNPTTAPALYSKTSACFLDGAFVLYPAGAAELAKAGSKTVGITEIEGVADESVLNKATQMAAAESGATTPTFIPVAPGSTNFSAMAAQVANAHEDANYIAVTPPGLFTLPAVLAQARPGIKMEVPGYLAQSPDGLAAFTKIPATKGMLVNNYTAFPTDTSVPGVRLFQKQIAKVDKSDIPWEVAFYPWVDAWGAMQILKTISSGPITSATILSAMKTATLHFDGVIPNWHYSYNSIGLGCDNNSSVYEGVYKGGMTITPLNGDKPVPGLSSTVIAYYKKSLAAEAG